MAKRFKVEGFSGKRKEVLIDLIIRKRKKELRKELYGSFWKQYHSHIYGIASVIGLFIAFFSFADFSVQQSNFGSDKPPVTGGLITIGGKNFEESSILVEIIGIVIEESTDPAIRVKRIHNLGETVDCRDKLVRDPNDIDIYPEYSGTILAEGLQIGIQECRDEKLHTVGSINRLLSSRTDDLQKVTWGYPFGFQNGYTLVMHKSRMVELGLDTASATISEMAVIARRLNLMQTPECPNRDDCLKNVTTTYNFKFHRIIPERSHVKAYDELYKSVNKSPAGQNRVDVIVGFTTDPQLNDPKLFELQDDKNCFLKYRAGILVRKEIIERYKGNGIKNALEKVAYCFADSAGGISESADLRIRNLLQKVESVTDYNGAPLITMENLWENNNPKAIIELRKVVREWLIERGLLDDSVTYSH